MIVTRWQASMLPSKQQLRMMYNLEGMVPEEEIYRPNEAVADHRHPFDEIRIVIEGELHMNIAGNKLVLRPGDRILIPSNTKHSMANEADSDCVSYCAHRVY